MSSSFARDYFRMVIVQNHEEKSLGTFSIKLTPLNFKGFIHAVARLLGGGKWFPDTR